MRKLALVAPFLLTISSLLILYTGYAGSMSPAGVLRAFVWLCVLLALLAGGIYWATRDSDWTGISLVVLVLALFFTPESFRLGAGLMALAALLWGCSAVVLKKRRNAQSLTIYLALSSAVLVLIPLYFLGRMFALMPAALYSAPRANDPGFVLTDRSVKPDIYVILLDGYGRSDLLKQYYSFDNSEFEGYLRSKGFVVPQQAQANYAKTIQAVTTALNMDYVQDLPPGVHEDAFWWLVKPYIDRSRVEIALERVGYQTFATGVDWDITDNGSAQHYYPAFPLRLTDFEGVFLNRVALGLAQGLIRPFISTSSYDAHRRTIQSGFDALAEIAMSKGGPKFVFAHLIALHAPYVFDREGNEITPLYPFTFYDASDFPGNPDMYADLYTGQVAFVNKRMEQVIDEILVNSQTPPIIILQADHGPGMFVNLRSSRDTCMTDRYSVFGAYYLPGVDASAVPDDISPVNIFRIVLHEYFGAELPLLKNASYFPRLTDEELGFEDVTGRINERCAVPLVGSTTGGH